MAKCCSIKIILEMHQICRIQRGGSTDSKRSEIIKRELTIKVVNDLMAEHMWLEDEAISKFMESEVYGCLQDEKTEAWHLSYKHSPHFSTTK